MLLDILEGKSACAMQILNTIKGVVTADMLEGHPNILVTIEAADRQKLVELTMPVLDSVERITENVHLLVNRENKMAPCFIDAGNAKFCQKQAIN
jgi:hypothetical protein